MKTGQTTTPSSGPIAEKSLFYQALLRQDAAAIRQLSQRIKPVLNQLTGAYHLSREDIEEWLNDAIVVTLQKIANGEYEFKNYDPATYAVAVARLLLANRLRKKKLPAEPLDGQEKLPGFDPEAWLLQKEQEQILANLLEQTGEDCTQLIRLRYYDNLHDEEVISQKLTRYTTVDSLKNKRSQCLKKLAALARKTTAFFR
jgi:RNA polymerase sigma factor (sigma-70 family)